MLILIFFQRILSRICGEFSVLAYSKEFPGFHILTSPGKLSNLRPATLYKICSPRSSAFSGCPFYANVCGLRLTRNFENYLLITKHHVVFSRGTVLLHLLVAYKYFK